MGGVDKRYLGLLVTRYLPSGLMMPVTGLLMLTRGLSLAELGFGVASQAVLVILLEIPTGGLADSLGRRPVLLLATSLDLVAVALVLAAHSPTAFVAARAVQGVYRALESGPLEAWYVDSALAEKADWHIESGLARGGVAIGLAIACASVMAAVLASIPSVAGIDPLALPIVAALVFRIVDLGALFVFLQEPHRSAARPTVRAGMVATPAVVRQTLRLLWASPALLALVAVELSWGAGLTGLEMFTPPRMAELLGDPERGVAVSAIAAALAWSIAAAGAALTGRFRDLVGGGPARLGAVLRLVQGGAVMIAALVAGPAGLLAGYFGFYLVHGSSNAVHYGMVHQLVDDEHRATMISANSLAGQLGAIGAGVGLGSLAANAGIPTALGVGAVVLAAAAPLYLVAASRSQPVSPADDGVALTRGSSRR